MFARAVRPAARAARRATALPAARRLVSGGPAPGPATNPVDATNLVLVTGAVAALVTAGSIVRELRSKGVHPSDPKEEEVEEEEAEAAADAESEDAGMAEAAVESAKEKVEHALSAADAALASLVAEAEAALGIAPAPSSGADALAAEAASQGAFNEETGEINWDCPCLGGMATGPCGEEFKAAFSCFVYSEAEPKGIDCVEKFKAMQDCFREHPDVYGEEEIEDEAAEEAPSEKN